MKIKQILAIVLSLGTLALTACGGKNSSSSVEDDPKLLQAPDYSAYTHKFSSYGYSGPNPGYWTLDDERIDLGEDFRTVERYIEYKEAGFDIYLPGHDISINSSNPDKWAQESVYMDRAHEAGLKVILNDQRLQVLSMKGKSLIGPDDPDTPEKDYEFPSEAALDAYVTECLSLYKDHPAFYGLMLGDEPRWWHVESYGQMYQSLTRVAPEVYLQYNLLPTVTTMGQMDELFLPVEGQTFATFEAEMLARYEQYLNSFLDVMPGVKYVQYDDYPMRVGYINDLYIPTLQVAAKVAKERGIQLKIVNQSYAMKWNGERHTRVVNEKDARWLNNMLIGFGVKEISYFTYWTKSYNKTDGEFFIDGASFITRAGDKTDIYYFMQKIMAENQKFAPTVLNFNYQGSRSYVNAPTYFNSAHMAFVDNSYVFKKVTDLKIDKECAMVTELYDSENNRFMYMVMNTVDTMNRGSMSYQTTEVTFSSEFTHVVVYKNGVGTPQKLSNGKVSVELTPGDAVYLLPY